MVLPSGDRHFSHPDICSGGQPASKWRITTVRSCAALATPASMASVAQRVSETVFQPRRPDTSLGRHCSQPPLRSLMLSDPTHAQSLDSWHHERALGRLTRALVWTGIRYCVFGDEARSLRGTEDREKSSQAVWQCRVQWNSSVSPCAIDPRFGTSLPQSWRREC